MLDRRMRLCAAALLVVCGPAHADLPGRTHTSPAYLKESVTTVKAELPVVVIDAAGATAHVGKLVAVKGIARDARISAAIVADGLVVYCLGLAKWPGEVSGKSVLAHGRLEHTAEFVARRGPGGEISPGTDGPVWVLRECRYEAR